MIALDLYVGENARSLTTCRRRRGRRTPATSNFGGVVARPLYGERLTVGILDFEPLT